MITIGIPVYNCEKELISKCIISILNQTEKDLEILIVNDCCTDNTMEYVEEIISKHQRSKIIRVINHKKNTGIAGARNTILEEAKGKYVFFIDCDDFLSTNAIKSLVNKAEIHQAEAVWGSVNEVDYETGQEIANIRYPNLSITEEDNMAYYAHHDSRENIRNFIWNILIRTDFIRHNNLRFKAFSYFDDYIFINSMLPLLKRAVLISNVTYHWVIRRGSQSHPIESKIPSYNMRQAIVANNYLKNYCRSLMEKSYFEGYCLKLHKNCYFSAYTMVKHRNRLDYPFTNKDIKNILSPIVSLNEIMKFKKFKKQNLFFYFLGKMPACLIPTFLKLINKYRLSHRTT